MHLPRWGKKTSDFEGLLRAARPEPRAELRNQLVRMIERAPRPTRRGVLHRTALAGAFTALVLAGLAAGGGVGYAAHLVSDSVVAVKVHVLDIQTTSAPSVRRNSAAIAQYGGGGATTTTTTVGSTTQPTGSGVPPAFAGSTGVTIVVNSDGSFTASCTANPCHITYTGTSAVRVLVYANGETVNMVTGSGADNVTILLAVTAGARQSGVRNDARAAACTQNLNAGAGDNNIHVVGPCKHVVIVGAGNSAIRVYGGTNLINAIGPGHQNIHAAGGTGVIRLGKGGSTVFTTKASKYLIEAANGSKDTINCNGSSETVIYDKGVDKLIACGAAKTIGR